ncbi:MAG: ATP-grasp domain-containing protein [Oscillospiraceae bacterium]
MKPVVLVTAIGTVASTTIISQLKNSADYYIIGGDIYLENQIATAKDVDEFHTFPSAIRDLEGYIDFAVDFCKKHKVNYYFATIDEEIANLSNHRNRFEEIGVKLCIPNHELIMTCHYKDRFSDWINENIPEIGIKRFRSFSEVEEYPVFIKPIEGRASIGCRKVESKSEADDLLKFGLNEEDYIIQEYRDDEIITVDLVRNAKHGQTQQVQRIEHLRNSSGCGIAVEIIDAPELHSICDRLMEKLDLNGVVNVEFFHHVNPSEESYKIIEINPRFGAGTSFTCLVGCDIVNAAVKIANGEKCELGTPAIGAHLAKRYETYRLD